MSPQCIIDRNVLNEQSLANMDDIALSFFASACGKNRGAFVLDPPDGQTYGCLQLPTDIGSLAGATNMTSDSVHLKDANDIKKQFVGGNLTAHDTLQVLDFLVQTVYQSTPTVEATPYACEVNGLATLMCPTTTSTGLPVIRAVSLAGLFVSAPWATQGELLSLSQARDFYTLEDFQDMADLGLNTVQIAVPTEAFTTHTKLYNVLEGVLQDVETAGLLAIIGLVATGDELNAIVSAANQLAELGSVVLAMELPSPSTLDVSTVIAAIRVQAPDLPLLVPVGQGDLAMLPDYGEHVYGSISFAHTNSIADIASSTSQEDRSKLFYHEATSCILRSPLEYTSCFRGMPLFVGSGFDISIDNCAFSQLDNFKDYGQCDRFEETVESDWWKRHRRSFAERQLFAYEQGMGWSYATWKLYNDNSDASLLDSPAKLLALKNVAAAGLFPSLHKDTPAKYACLNPPTPDFVLGDDTLAPTMGPPPDCGNGWWNYTTSKCDYWIPPPPPTAAPTVACPICETSSSTTNEEIASTYPAAWGAIAGILLTFVLMKVVNARTDRRSDYSSIPN